MAHASRSEGAVTEGQLLQQEPRHPTYSLDMNTITEIWELCILASRSPDQTINAELAKQAASSIQDSLQKVVGQHLLPASSLKPSREKAKAALAARKRKYQADKAFKEVDVVYGPLKTELAAYEREKGMTSNTGTKTVLETFEKRVKEAAKKAEEIGKKRILEDTDDSGSDETGITTPPLNTRKARKAPVKNPCIAVAKPRLTGRKKVAFRDDVDSGDD